MVTRSLLLIGVLICVIASVSVVQGQTIKNNFHRAQTVKPATTAPSDYQPLALEDCASAPDEYQGKLVTVTAEVISVDAKYQGINLFDTNTKTLMGVSLIRLPKAQRRSVVLEPVHRVSVYGSVATKAGRCVIEAHKVVPIAVDTAAQVPGR